MIQAPTYQSFDAFNALLTDAGSAVLSTHINPDGDGLGSQLALASFLESRDIRTTILNADRVPSSYRFLDPNGTTLLHFDAERHTKTVEEADLFIVVDTNHPDRLGSLAPIARNHRGRKVIIDHHLEPSPFADVVVSDADACATGEIVFRFLEHVQALPLTADIATALYTAIMTDTGSFRFPKTDGDVHRIVAGLVDAGADPAAVYDSVYDQGDVNRLRLLGQVLASLQLHLDGQACVLSVSEEMFRRTGTSEADTDKFVTYGLAMSGVRVALMFSELPSQVKLNVRSKGTVPANEIAKAFGGNGHLNAAGARIPRISLDKIIPDVLKTTSRYLTKE